MDNHIDTAVQVGPPVHDDIRKLLKFHYGLRLRTKKAVEGRKEVILEKPVVSFLQLIQPRNQLFLFFKPGPEVRGSRLTLIENRIDLFYIFYIFFLIRQHALPPFPVYFRACPMVLNSSFISTGFPMCPSMPESMALAMSSAKVLAVMA